MAKSQRPKNGFQRKLLEIFANDIRVQNDHIAKYDRLIKPLFDPNASASEHEEALRSFGELLGFEASRPEQETDNESTLDVLWLATSADGTILFELKTKKKPDGALNLDDIGRGFNHLEWAADAHAGASPYGLIFICDGQRCVKAASPSEQMWVAGVGAFRQLYDETIQMLRALQRMTPLNRYAEIAAISARRVATRSDLSASAGTTPYRCARLARRMGQRLLARGAFRQQEVAEVLDDLELGGRKV